ncbi:hypothetical protein FA15DRAFT_494305 [Coprinopsis marcescibilis]|uniref:Secreted protein n=1 Tax=Coprinopsis marcescibilis TaxID=230819 RepID=A0A5C3KRD0_COPMA|nr:hypothetical protein FA15DRAFT_494305 [Coprinopsis marcescibilis]
MGMTLFWLVIVNVIVVSVSASLSVGMDRSAIPACFFVFSQSGRSGFLEVLYSRRDLSPLPLRLGSGWEYGTAPQNPHPSQEHLYLRNTDAVMIPVAVHLVGLIILDTRCRAPHPHCSLSDHDVMYLLIMPLRFMYKRTSVESALT